MIQDASAARFCPYCGKPVAAPDTAFCAYCGRSLVAAQQPPNVAPTPVVPPPPPVNATPPSPVAPAAPAPYGYAGMGMAPAASAAPSAGRMIGVMLGVVGVVLVLAVARVVVSAYLYRLLVGGYFAYLVLLWMSPGITRLILVVPLCYWLALLRLRVVSLARLVIEVLVASVVFMVATVLIADLSALYFLRGGVFAATRWYTTRGLLAGVGQLSGFILPVVVGAGIGVGAALLFTRWSVVPKLSTQTRGRTVLHFTLVLGSFAGFALVDDILYYAIFTTILFGRRTNASFFVLDTGNIVLQFVFAICVVIVVSIWALQALRAVPASHASPAGATPMPPVPSYPAPPTLSSGVPSAAPQHDPAQQTPPTETQE